MRVTNSMISSRMLMNLNRNLGRMDKWNQQISTGKKFSKPSDDPVGVSKSLELTTTLNELEQYKTNARDATSWLEITESSVTEVKDILQRARELAVSADGAETESDKEKIKAEVDQLRTQLIKVANSTYGGNQIFSGFKTNKKLLNDDGTYNIDTSNQENMKYKVGVSEDIDINVLGHKLFGVEGSNLDDPGVNDVEANKNTDKAELIAVFDEFSKALDNDDQDNINKTLSRIDKHMENTLAVLGEVGTKTSRMEMTMKRIDKDTLNFTNLLSENEDVDMAEAIMNMKMEENVYRASLSTSAKVIQPTLVDFIR